MTPRRLWTPGILLLGACAATSSEHDLAPAGPKVSTVMHTNAEIQGDPQATSVKPYPLSICLVGGNGLSKMGKPEVIVHEGREIKLCCDDCVAQFKKDPANYLKVLDEAENKLAASKNEHPEKK